MQERISPFISQKFKFWSFISMTLLVFVHGYNLQQRYLQPFTTVNEHFTFNTFLQYFLANGIFRFRIPMLFAISGYLYALYDYKPYGERTRKRVKTLLLPYLLWSAIGLVITYLLENFQATKMLIESSHLIQIDEKRMFLHEYKWYEWLGRWIFFIVPYQLWFIRVLLVYNIAYPLIRRWVTNKTARKIFFSIAIFLWLSTAGFFFVEGEGLLFFSLGVWMQKENFNLETPAKWMKPKLWFLIFVVASALKTFLAFKAEPVLHHAIYPVLSILHKLTIFSGLITAWFGLDYFVKMLMKQNWFVWMSSFSFIIYALHVPLITYAIDGMFGLLQCYINYRLITFFLLPTIVIIFCIATGYMLRTIFPKVYSLLTGGRGI